MTSTEFEQWYDDYTAVFPETFVWIDRMDEEPRRTMLRHWQQTLSAYRLEDALAVTVRMLSGMIEPVAAYERSLTPTKVAQACEQIARDRKTAESKREVPFEIPGDPENWDTKSIIRQLGDCIRAGGDAHELAKKLMPLSDDDLPRYRCLFCKDTGMVMCWHPRSMALAARRQLKPEHGCYANSVRCSCKRGDRWEGYSRGYDPHTKTYSRNEPTIFNERQWLPCFLMDQREVDELTEFMANYKPANYDDSFDAFNDQQTVEWT